MRASCTLTTTYYYYYSLLLLLLLPVFQIIGEEPEWITYDRWGTALPEGTFAAAVGAEDFQRVLAERGGPDARAQWCARAGRRRAFARARVALASLSPRSRG